VGVEHVLHALAELKAELFTSMLRSLSKNPQEACGLLLGLIEERVNDGPKHTGEGVRLSAQTIDLFKRTLKVVRSNGRRRIEATDLFITLLVEEKSLLRELLRKLLADPQAEAKIARQLIGIVESVSTGRPSRRGNYLYSVDEMVRIKTGPFAAFTGKVEAVDEEQSTITVKIFIMGREQPVQLRFLDAEKINFPG
jgi:ATP-dependent Clp protease ATP-binding subunit ClpA